MGRAQRGFQRDQCDFREDIRDSMRNVHATWTARGTSEGRWMRRGELEWRAGRGLRHHANGDGEPNDPPGETLDSNIKGYRTNCSAGERQHTTKDQGHTRRPSSIHGRTRICESQHSARFANCGIELRPVDQEISPLFLNRWLNWIWLLAPWGQAIHLMC
jgi:hypothetical protein